MKVSSWIGSLNRGSPYLIAIFVFYICVTVFIMTGREVVGGDSPATAYLPVSVLEHRTLRLDPFINRNPFFDLDRQPHYVVESDGHYYSKFSPVTSLMVTPLYALDFLLLGPPGDCIECNAARYIGLSRMASAVIEAGVAVVVFLLLRHRVSQSLALVLALGYAFSTYSWAAATNTLTTQSTGELWIALSVLSLLRIDASGASDRGPWIAMALGSLAMAGAARVQLAPVILVLGGYLLWHTLTHRWLRPWHFIPAAGVAALFLGYNTWAFGSPLSTGYGSEALAGWTTPFLSGFLGILFSPAHGLLMYSPLLLMGLFAGLGQWVKVFRSGSVDRGALSPAIDSLDLVLPVAVLFYLVLMSHWWAWYGGVAYNQRMLQEVHPLLIFLLASYLGRQSGDRRLPAVLLGVALLWGAGLNGVRLTFYDRHLTWLETSHPEIVWSLRDIEVLQYIRWHGVRRVFIHSSITIIRWLLVVGPSFFLLGRLLSYPRFWAARKEEG